MHQPTQQSQTVLPENLQNLKKIAQIFREARDPNGLIMQAAMKNPAMKYVYDMGQKYHGDYNLAFREVCKERGIDPDSVMRDLRTILN